MAEQKDFPIRQEAKKRRKPYQVGQEIRNPYKPPKGKIPENTQWRPISINQGKGYPEVWRLDSTLPEVPTLTQFPPEKPPEVIREETKDAQIDDWHKRTDN